MKKKSRAVILSAAVLTAVLCVGSALASPRPGGKAGQPAQSVRPSGGQQERSDNSKYTVTAYEGRLAVYLTTHMDSPQYVTDVDISTLPAADREALQKGIPVYTEEELTSVLEDYSS